ncbi:MAG TPA: hypothetical protein VLU25_06440 [Acidobacteriota bacterium]|nr:hypothetical protein [Acidobacteriota bacterium]
MDTVGIRELKDRLSQYIRLNTASLIPETAILALDKRLRRCALALGLQLLPPARQRR